LSAVVEFDPQKFAITAAVIGALVAWARNLPVALGRWLRAQILVSVEIRDPDLVRWVGVTAVERWSLPNRRTAAILRVAHGSTTFVLEPARGVHLLRHGLRWVLLDRGKDEAAGKRAATELMGIPSVETVALRAWGRDPALLHAMVAEAVEHGRSRFAELSLVRIADPWGGWADMPECSVRAVESLVLPDGMAEDLLGRLRQFLGRPGWYAERGIPWRIGVGLYGPPGTGKSSLVRALCGELKVPLHIVNLASQHMDDGALMRLLAGVGTNAAILLDDLDASALPAREKSKDGGITLAGLLAALDGPGAAEGRILFICTNHPERLDAALIRPGRIDIPLTLGVANPDQAYRLHERWFPGRGPAAAAFATTFAGRSMAELQGELMSISSKEPADAAQ
jgi:chaperone BCS1